MVGVGIAGAGDRAHAREALASAERAWGERAAQLVVVVRAVLAAQLGLRAGDPLVDDLTQEVVRRALDGRERARAGAPLRPWVLGIARHVAADEARRRARLAPLDEAPDAAVGALSEPARDPEELALRAEGLERLRVSLAELPEPWRRALLLFHIEDLSYREIAGALSVPMGTVATWIARGRAQLVARLGGERAGRSDRRKEGSR
jgi:RNA polymerase sigma factor (sigma-70 family)